MTINVDIFRQHITWEEVRPGHYEAEHNGHKLRLDINPDFPMEDLYTLSIEDEDDAIGVNDWPDGWDRA